MTIAAAFNEIAVAQGGTASSSGTIAGAIDALTDALAGSDVQSPSTIEGAVRLLGEHIGGGGSSTIKLYLYANTQSGSFTNLVDTEDNTYQLSDDELDGHACKSAMVPIGAVMLAAYDGTNVSAMLRPAGAYETMFPCESGPRFVQFVVPNVAAWVVLDDD